MKRRLLFILGMTIILGLSACESKNADQYSEETEYLAKETLIRLAES